MSSQSGFRIIPRMRSRMRSGAASAPSFPLLLRLALRAPTPSIPLASRERKPELLGGMCAVRKYLKHMGRMGPSYPVHVQRRHARDRLIHLIYKIFRCCGGRFRRCGVKSAYQTHELPRNPDIARKSTVWPRDRL